MNARPIGSAPPPFYWKVPVPEKDYMSENYRRIRQIANQGQKKRTEPLKAAFIPGVTKNEKYAHIQSRVGESLKARKSSDNFEPPVQNYRGQPQRMAPNLNQQANRRLSKSSTDLRSGKPVQSKAKPLEKFTHSDTNGHGSKSHQSNSALPATIRRRRVSEESFSPNQESVYNWRFKDDVVNECSGATLSNGLPNSSIPAKYCHRVEYLPCDGICAEENFVVGDTQPDSARSSSSRTSRGCNTEETRILGDVIKSHELEKPIDNAYEGGIGQNLTQTAGTPMKKSRSVLTLPSQEAKANFVRNHESGDWYLTKSKPEEGSYELDSRLKSMRISNAQTAENGRVKTSLSQTSLKSAKFQANNGTGGGGEFPHTLGTVPKYLKQRQEEWKMQEQERKEAEMNSNVPHGYVLLSDEERMEHLKTFKRNYDALINDLNRIPIRIDTIRVREHKVQLEQQLTRLEEAMKTFSRPRVWVKVDG